MTSRRRSLSALATAGLLAGCVGASTPTPAPACPTQAPTAEEVPGIVAGADQAVLVTSLGEFAVDLYPEAAPIATANFIALARCGFYDGISFHRVIPGFVVQAGDPQTKENRGDFQGLGTGGPGYRFVIEPPAAELNYDQYVVAMANAGGTDTNGSQFFINLRDLNTRLQRLYTIIGRVETGTEAVDAIGEVATSANDVPIDPVIIETVRIEGQAEPE